MGRGQVNPHPLPIMVRPSKLDLTAAMSLLWEYVHIVNEGRPIA